MNTHQSISPNRRLYRKLTRLMVYEFTCWILARCYSSIPVWAEACVSERVGAEVGEAFRAEVYTYLVMVSLGQPYIYPSCPARWTTCLRRVLCLVNALKLFLRRNLRSRWRGEEAAGRWPSASGLYSWPRNWISFLGSIKRRDSFVVSPALCSRVGLRGQVVARRTEAREWCKIYVTKEERRIKNKVTLISFRSLLNWP